MKSVISLLVLLHCCLSGAQVHKDRDGVSVNEIQQVDYEDRESRGNDIQTDKQRAEAALTHSQQTYQPDIHTVLREMSTMMAEQRVELRHTKTELGAMEARLRASESRLTASESQVEKLKIQLTSKVEELTNRNEGLTLLLITCQSTPTSVQLDKVVLTRLCPTDRKVAFSASLAAPGQEGDTGPFNTAITLVYRNIYSNIGNAYNPTTGIFTAPVRASHVVNSSNGVSLLLEVGDVVYVHLWAGRKIYDDGNRHSTFSGDLLFTMWQSSFLNQSPISHQSVANQKTPAPFPLPNHSPFPLV
eukprot:XP_013996572.1 PREDICTED: uncharacterized protein LOC106569587 [Salmo salar]